MPANPLRDRSSPTGVTGPEMEARRAARLSALEILRAGRTPLQVCEVAGQAVAVADAAIQVAMVADPPRTASACREGCAWCCHKVVGTTVPEVLRIVTHLQQSLSAVELQEANERVARLHEQRKTLQARGRFRTSLPCALLVDNRCSVYPVRPLTCRGFNSSDARQCELSLDPRNRAVVPAYAPQQRLATLVLDGTRAGLAEAGLSGTLLELTAALHIALTDADALHQWRAGKASFEAARMP
jgi:Fe-S-cluster containining protein